MADPRNHKRSSEDVGEIFAALDDLDENVSENSGIIRYSQSLSDMFAGNEHFFSEEVDPLLFPEEHDENLTIGFGSNSEDISEERLGGNRATRVVKTVGAGGSRDLPERYRAHIDRAGGSDIKLIFEKKLFKTDLNARRARLTMQHTRMLPEFLTETKWIKNGGEMDANLVDTQLKERTMTVATWKSMEASYVLKNGWNDVVRENDLKIDDEVQIWSFRVGGELRLALVVVDKAVGDGEESSEKGT